MWLDRDEIWHRWTPRGEREWPVWVLIEPHEITADNRPEPCLIAVYDDGTEVGPFPVVLPHDVP